MGLRTCTAEREANYSLVLHTTTVHGVAIGKALKEEEKEEGAGEGGREGGGRREGEAGRNKRSEPQSIKRGESIAPFFFPASSFGKKGWWG